MIGFLSHGQKKAWKLYNGEDGFLIVPHFHKDNQYFFDPKKKKKKGCEASVPLGMKTSQVVRCNTGPALSGTTCGQVQASPTFCRAPRFPSQPPSLGFVLAQAGVCSGKAPAATHSQGRATLQGRLLGGLPAGTELPGPGAPNKRKRLVPTGPRGALCPQSSEGDGRLCPVPPSQGRGGRHGGGRCLAARATGPWAHLLGAGTAVALYWAPG